MKTVELKWTAAAASALIVAGCDQQAPPPPQAAPQNTAVCVDHAGNRVADDQCARPAAHVGVSPFLWYYLGRQSALPYYGQRVAGGSFTRTAGATYFHAPVSYSMTRAAAISRGGFGSSARSFHSFGE